MNVKTKAKTREHSFRIPLAESESIRFETYISKTGLKKTFFVRKAILAYLDRAEQEAQ